MARRKPYLKENHIKSSLQIVKDHVLDTENTKKMVLLRKTQKSTLIVEENSKGFTPVHIFKFQQLNNLNTPGRGTMKQFKLNHAAVLEFIYWRQVLKTTVTDYLYRIWHGFGFLDRECAKAAMKITLHERKFQLTYWSGSSVKKHSNKIC